MNSVDVAFSVAEPGPALAVQARASTRRRYLMCSPTYFCVPYVHNPWMDPNQPVNVELAGEQWNALKQTYERFGHSVEVIEPQPGLADMVFAANGGTVIEGRALGAQFRSAERAPEADHYRRWFLEHGYSSVVMPSKVNEGEGDFVWTGTLLLAGTGFRTEYGAHADAQEFFGVPVVSLRLIDPRYYHLDTALFVVDDRADEPVVAYYPEAFSHGSQQVLRRLFPDAVIVTAADAMCLGLNAVSDGHNVVLPMEAVGLAGQLVLRGYVPTFVDISELRKSGGGAKCATMELRDAIIPPRHVP